MDFVYSCKSKQYSEFIFFIISKDKKKIYNFVRFYDFNRITYGR